MRRPSLALVVPMLILPSMLSAQTPQEPAPQPTIEERLDRLEHEIQRLRIENEELRSRLGGEASAPAAPAAQPVADPPKTEPKKAEGKKLVVGGMLQGQMESGDRVDTRFPDDRFRMFVRRARVSVSGAVADVDYRMEGDFTGTLGDASGTRFQMTDGYVHWAARSFAQLRAGQFKTPFGFEQLFSDSRLSTPERSLSSDRLTVGRQLGVQLSGETRSKALAWAAGVFNGNGVNTTANDDDELLVAARVTGRLPLGTMLIVRPGAAVYRSDDARVSFPADFRFDSTPETPARDNLFNGVREGRSVELQLEGGRFAIWAEAFRTRFEPRSHAPHGGFDADGGYAQVMWTVRPGKMQLVGKFDVFDPDDRTGGDDTKEWSLGGTYFVRGDNLKLQLLHIHADGPLSDDSDRIVARVQSLF